MIAADPVGIIIGCVAAVCALSAVAFGFAVRAHTLAKRKDEKNGEIVLSACDAPAPPLQSSGVQPTGNRSYSLLKAFGFQTNGESKDINPIDVEQADDKINFSLSYDKATSSLIVNVAELQVPSLLRSNVGAETEVFVRGSLMPDERKVVRSRNVKSGAGGVAAINQALAFDGFGQKSLPKLTLYLHAIETRSLSVIGEARLPMKNITFVNCPVYWKHLEPLSVDIKGRIMFGMCYDGGKLKLHIDKGALIVGSVIEPDTFIRATLFEGSERLSLAKTTVQVANGNPTYNEHLELDLPAAKTDAVELRVQVIELGGPNEDIGCVRLGVDSGPDGKHWAQVLGQPGANISKWHKLL